LFAASVQIEREEEDMNRSMMLSVVALSLIAGSTQANLVVNGDFQTGTLGPSTTTYALDGSMWPETTWNIVSFDTLHPSWGDFNDHTFGDSRGYYMIINGSTSPVGAAWAQTVAVTPGTDYQLSGWFASLFGGAPSSVEFRIDGQLIQPNFTLTSNIGAWEEHAVTFNSGQRSQISIEIWDTSGVASGNDYAIDDISLAAVPAPGAMGLIGVGGLLASRRRRA